jgi:hypothetical protein
MTEKKQKFLQWQTIFNNLSPRRIYGRLIKEFIYARKYKKEERKHDLVELNIKPWGFAANYSLLYFLVRFLFEEKPKNILELGSGETTKIINRYLKKSNPAQGVVLEHNQEWYENMKELYDAQTLDYVNCPLVPMEVKDTSCKWYDFDFKDNTEAFNLVLIDGPYGTPRNSRMGCLQYLTQIIDPSDFIIVFDDASRKGERDTIKLTAELLQKAEINYLRFELHGCKQQTCFTSGNYEEFMKEIT